MSDAFHVRLSSFRPMSALSYCPFLSACAVARTPLPGRWLWRARRRLHRDLFRLANEESMRNRQHERLLYGLVGSYLSGCFSTPPDVVFSKGGRMPTFPRLCGPVALWVGKLWDAAGVREGRAHKPQQDRFCRGPTLEPQASASRPTRPGRSC